MSDISNILNKNGQIEFESLTSKAASIIRHKIITGEFAQQQRLRETEISNLLGISRLSIREAFLMLEKEGLLVKEKNKFTQVIDFSEKDIFELYSLRIAIECLCAESLIDNGNIPETQLKDCVLVLEKIVKKKSFDGLKWLDADLTFHETIVVASNHHRAINIWLVLKNQIKTLLFPQVKENSLPLRATVSEESHTNMLDALLKGDKIKMNTLLEKHITGGRDQVLKSLTVNKT